MTVQPASYARHCLPAEIVNHVVWLHHVFSLNLHDVELILKGDRLSPRRKEARQMAVGPGVAGRHGDPWRRCRRHRSAGGSGDG
jgi:hypothetical protein